MKLSKSLILTTLVAGGLFAGSAAVQAQNATNTPPPAGGPPAAPRGMRGGMNVDQIAATLKLDDATKAKFTTILEDQRKQFAELRTGAQLTPEERRTKVEAIRADTDKQLKAVLTTEQFDQWQKMNQPHFRRVSPPTDNPPANPPKN